MTQARADLSRHGPVTDSERADVLDALRGLALLGILISHLPGFSGYEFMTHGEQASRDWLGVDGPLSAISAFLINGKFFSLFSLLFGIGFAIQLESALRRGANFVRRFARRLLILFVIGLAHALVWYGDILKDYAVIGLLLIVTARWTASRTGWTAITVLVIRALWPLVVWPLVVLLAPVKHGTDPVSNFFTLSQTFGGTDTAAMFSANLELVKIKALQMIYEGKAISIFGMFLIGAYIGKRRLYRDLALNSRTFRRVFAVCAPLGILGNAVWVPLGWAVPRFPPSALWAAEQVIFAIAVPAMTLAYATGFALAWQHPYGKALRALAPPGRMALTTYVSQTLLAVYVFYGVGLGFGGKLGIVGCIATALTIFALQCVLSAAWLNKCYFGPLEWIWRQATYGRALPMIRRATLNT